MTAPCGRCACGRGLRMTVPVMPEDSSARRIASPATSLTASASPLPRRPAHASAAASVTCTRLRPRSSRRSLLVGSWAAGPAGPEEGMPLPCCSNCSFLVGLLGFLQQLRRPQLELIAALEVGGLDEIAEERMRPVWTRPERSEERRVGKECKWRWGREPWRTEYSN